MAIFWKNDIVGVYTIAMGKKLLSFLKNSKIVYGKFAPAFIWYRKKDLVAE